MKMFLGIAVLAGVGVGVYLLLKHPTSAAPQSAPMGAAQVQPQSNQITDPTAQVIGASAKGAEELISAITG